MVLEVILVVLGVVLRQCSEQMFGTDSARNNVPSQLRYKDLMKDFMLPLLGRRDMVLAKQYLRTLLVGSEHCSDHCLFRTSVPNTVSEPL